MIEPGLLDGSSAPLRTPAVVGVEVDAEAVLYHEDFGTVHHLDPIATIIWNSLDGESSLTELATDLAAAFSADVEIVTADVVAAVRDFGRQGLLDRVSADPDVVALHQLGAAGQDGLPDG